MSLTQNSSIKDTSELTNSTSLAIWELIDSETLASESETLTLTIPPGPLNYDILYIRAKLRTTNNSTSGHKVEINPYFSNVQVLYGDNSAEINSLKNFFIVNALNSPEWEHLEIHIAKYQLIAGEAGVAAIITRAVGNEYQGKGNSISYSTGTSFGSGVGGTIFFKPDTTPTYKLVAGSSAELFGLKSQNFGSL